MHSLLFLLRECFLKILWISTPFLEKHVSVFCSFWQFPLPLSKSQGVVFSKTSFLHSPFPEIREWILQKQAFCTPPSQKSESGFCKNKPFLLLPAKILGMVFTQTSFLHPPRRMMASTTIVTCRANWRCPCAGPLRLATHSGSEDRANIEANDLARHPQFLSPDTLT